MKIFVGGLPFKTTEEELQREFEVFGAVDSVKIIVDHETLRSRGFGFVQMRDRAQALAAIAGLNGKELAGQVLKVNEAKPRETRTGHGRDREGGGFGSGGRSGRPGGGYGSKGGGGSIYDSKGRSNDRGGNRGRGKRGPGSGGRSGGGGGSRSR